MSKNMQLKVLVTSCYENDIENAYPNLARSLRHLDADLVRRNPSLYELAGQADMLLYRHDGTSLRDALLPYKDKLRTTYNAIQKNIADWNLSQADKLLYSLEDLFEEIESILD